jgi:hypothetical protein
VEKKKEGGGVRKNFLVLMCGEVLMGSVYGKMKHGMELWVANYHSETSGLLGLINCFPQIHRWICVKITSILVWKA